MTLDDRQELREKHADDGDGQCSYCLHEHYPCDVILTLDELDRAISAAEAYGITVRHLVERDFERTNGLVSPAQMDTCSNCGIVHKCVQP